MGFLSRAIAEQFEKEKPEALNVDVRLISGTHDNILHTVLYTIYT
jgi:hypothetical protein